MKNEVPQLNCLISVSSRYEKPNDLSVQPNIFTTLYVVKRSTHARRLSQIPGAASSIMAQY